MGIISELYADRRAKEQQDFELRRLAAEEAARKETALAIRDSNQANSEFLKHKNEMEMQEKIAQYQPADMRSEFSGQPLTTATQQWLSMVNAGNTMNDMEVAGYLAPGQKAVNEYQSALAESPLAGAIGQATGEANLAGQQAAKSRFTTARATTDAQLPNAAALTNAQDQAGIVAANLARTQGQSQLPGAALNAIANQQADTLNKQAHLTLVPDNMRTMFDTNAAERAKAGFTTATLAGENPQLAGEAANLGHQAGMAVSKAVIANPAWKIDEQARLRDAAKTQQEKMMDHLMNGGTFTPTGGIVPLSQAPVVGTPGGVATVRPVTTATTLTPAQIATQLNATLPSKARKPNQ